MSEEKRGIADAENGGTTETMADYARELEASFRTIRAFQEYEAGNISEKIIVCQRLQIWREFKKCAGASGYIHEKI